MGDPDPGFTLRVSENKYLSEQDDEVVALLRVAAAGVGGAEPDAAEVILLDCSGSMAAPPTKLGTAKKATCAAIDALRDGVQFAVVRGTHEAVMAYPEQQRLAVAGPETRAEAKRAVHRLVASDGTAMGKWLDLASALLHGQHSAVRHAMLITDGRQEHESRSELDKVLAGCVGRFSCDARGIGDDWQPIELLHIASVLNGQARGVARLDEMVGDLAGVMHASMRKSVPDVTLRVRTVLTARLYEIRQVHPTITDLTPQGVRLDERTDEFAVGAWTPDEARDYLVRVRVDPPDDVADEDLYVARVDLLTGDQHAGSAMIVVHWTDDGGLSIPLDPKVAHYLGQERLGDAVRDGCDAYRGGDVDRAVAELGLAVRLATESHNEAILRRLTRMVEILDADAGLVRIRADLPLSEILATYTDSVMTTMSGGVHAPDQGPIGPPRVCPECGHPSPPDAVVCEKHGHPLPPLEGE
ncbi:MAG TPA: VWA domain-containing protein [Pseudonocardiaceae bacterium]